MKAERKKESDPLHPMANQQVYLGAAITPLGWMLGAFALAMFLLGIHHQEPWLYTLAVALVAGRVLVPCLYRTVSSKVKMSLAGGALLCGLLLWFFASGGTLLGLAKIVAGVVLLLVVATGFVAYYFNEEVEGSFPED